MAEENPERVRDIALLETLIRQTCEILWKPVDGFESKHKSLRWHKSAGWKVLALEKELAPAIPRLRTLWNAQAATRGANVARWDDQVQPACFDVGGWAYKADHNAGRARLLDELMAMRMHLRGQGSARPVPEAARSAEVPAPAAQIESPPSPPAKSATTPPSASPNWKRIDETHIEVRLGARTHTISGEMLTWVFEHVAGTPNENVTWSGLLTLRMHETGRVGSLKPGTMVKHGQRIQEALGTLSGFWDQDGSGACWKGEPATTEAVSMTDT